MMSIRHCGKLKFYEYFAQKLYNRIMVKIIILLLILSASFTAVYSIWRFKEPAKTPTAALITINDVVIEAERADSFLKRQQGLSGRKQLKENGGMFFIFDKSNFFLSA